MGTSTVRDAAVEVSKGRAAATPAKGAPVKASAKAAPAKRTAKPAPAKRVTSTRSTPAKPSRPAKGTAARVARTSARPVKRPAKTAPKGKPAARKGGRPVVPPEIQIKIRDLDPQSKCGPGTSVVRLIRVDEIVNRVLNAHLVFHDKYGWYCEHGRGCPAVRHAQRHAQQVARPQ